MPVLRKTQPVLWNARRSCVHRLGPVNLLAQEKRTTECSLGFVAVWHWRCVVAGMGESDATPARQPIQPKRGGGLEGYLLVADCPE